MSPRSRLRARLALLAVLAGAGAAPGAAAAKRPLTVDDLFALRGVRAPRVSPDGAWVVYGVRTLDAKEDRRSSDLFMTSWDGATTLQLTHTKESEESARFSPDGKLLAFLSGRGTESEKDQLWIMNRLGGEAERVTDVKGEVLDYDFAPDGKRLVLVVRDPDPRDGEPADKGDKGEKDAKKKKTPPPIVIDRYYFKEDETGYLDARRRHLYLLDLPTRKLEALTPGAFDEVLPAWSPDGGLIAFVSKRGSDFDRTYNWDVFVIEPRVGASARAVTTFDGPDMDPDWESVPAWSPDGKWIAYLQGGPKELMYYAVHRLAIAPASGGPARVLTGALDRNVASPRFTPDGKSILFLIEDDGAQQLARVPAAGGPIERLVSGPRDVLDFDIGKGGQVAALVTAPSEPPEVFALDGFGLAPRPLSRQNQELLAGLGLAAVEETRFRSKDGTEIHGFLVKPPDYRPGTRIPTLLRIHGGPVSQFGHEFSFEWQLFAARGYAVVACNPRGSSGRGEAFSKAIFADWGNKDAEDVLAAVDDAVAKGVADPAHLGVGGWSYGGILTNYVITKDARFKAATSGASISNILAGYGTDMYVRDYETELGLPWKKTDVWLKLSSPFLHADRIATPTLFLCGDKDFNVPLLNSEQMYQALKSLGRDTQLVIYPGQFHGITTPSYQKDRLARYVAWYDRLLRGSSAPPATP